MSDQPGINRALEYQTLREELAQGRKYVFERPLLIVGVGVAAIPVKGGEYIPVLLMLLVGLLLFNFWFTVNRLMSSARIVAYIRLVLEGSEFPWEGWETSLRKYRVWVNDDPQSKRQSVDAELRKKDVADALMYYPPIYQLHIALVCLSTVAEVILTLKHPDATNLSSMIILLGLVVLFAYHCLRWRPGVMRDLIERNLVIWRHILKS